MGLEVRGGSLYYYKKERRDGRVVSVYQGRMSGDAGRLWYSVARLDHSRRLEEAAERRRQLAPVVELQALDREARELADAARELAALALLATGYHRHKGTWRKRRGDAVKAAATNTTRDLPPLPASDDDSKEARVAILRRCDRPDATAEDVEALRQLLARAPHLVTGLGDLMRNALERAADMAHGTPLWATTSQEHLAERRKALGYAEAPALEKPLIEHLLTCEVRLAMMELRYTGAWKESMTWTAAEHWERLLSASQKRYLAAVETLAKVRRVRVELARVLPDGSAEAVAVETPGA